MEIISSNQVHQVTIFTYTNADVVSRKHVQMPFEESTTAVEPTPHMPFQRMLVEALSAFTRVNSGSKGRDEVKERLLREDSCETMIIMAAVQNFRYLNYKSVLKTDSNQIVLTEICLRLHKRVLNLFPEVIRYKR